jgi:hypothetical protein
MLYGSGKFAHHWLFWQSAIRLMNGSNPSGNITGTFEYRSMLIVLVVASFVVAVKRVLIGLYLGRQTYYRYAEDLARVMKKSLLVSQVANLARDIELFGIDLNDFGLAPDQYTLCEEGSSTGKSLRNVEGGNIFTGINFSASQTVKINELLGAWEEPEIANEKDDSANIGAIIQFRQSLSYLNTAFPFSPAFGPAGSRKECVESTESVYHRLLLSTPGAPVLRFDTLALLAVQRDGDLDDYKLKDLIRLFRPDRDGTLTVVDFAKSVDAVYKELRLLRASVNSAAKVSLQTLRTSNVESVL